MSPLDSVPIQALGDEHALGCKVLMFLGGILSLAAFLVSYCLLYARDIEAGGVSVIPAAKPVRKDSGSKAPASDQSRRLGLPG